MLCRARGCFPCCSASVRDTEASISVVLRVMTSVHTLLEQVLVWHELGRKKVDWVGFDLFQHRGMEGLTGDGRPDRLGTVAKCSLHQTVPQKTIGRSTDFYCFCCKLDSVPRAFVVSDMIAAEQHVLVRPHCAISSQHNQLMPTYCAVVFPWFTCCSSPLHRP